MWPSGSRGTSQKTENGRLAYGEPLNFWRHEIRAMLAATEVYFYAQKSDEDWLSEHLQRSNGELLFDYEGVERSITSGSDDLVQAGHHFVFQLIEEALVLYSITPLPCWSPNWPRDKPQVELKFRPKSPLASMWLQFAQSVAGDAEYRPCKRCGKWFEISAGRRGKRRDTLFCGDGCRVGNTFEINIAST